MNDAKAWLPEEAWFPCTPPFSTGTLGRSASHLLRVVDQFEVAAHPRYRPQVLGDKTLTFCNIFAWDVTRALACEVPHWWLDKGETTANQVGVWLATHGRNHGWKLCGHSDAIRAADDGRPALIHYTNPIGPGHIAVMVPGGFIAQAGRTCFARGTLSQGFGQLPVTFWTHA